MESGLAESFGSRSRASSAGFSEASNATHREKLRRESLKPEGEEADRRLEALRSASSIFRALSDTCLRAVCDKLEVQTFPATADVRLPGGGICILRDGSVSERRGNEVCRVNAGQVVGEAALLGLNGVVPAGTADALTDCIAWVLSRKDFQETLAHHAADYKAFNLLERDAVRPKSPSDTEGERLKRVMQAASLFRSSDPTLVANLATHMENVFFAPGEDILKKGEGDKKNSIYLVLGGRIELEESSGVLMHTARANEVLGLPHVLGMDEACQYSAKAWQRGPVWCARLPTRPFNAALKGNPEARTKIQEQATQHAKVLAKEAQRRHRWLSSVAVPALAKTPLLEGCPEELLMSVSKHLESTEFEAGDVITQAGDVASSMIVLLEGEFELESRCRAQVGRLTAGGVMGEPEVLGLFDTRIVTARATCEGSYLEVPAEALREALRQQNDEAMHEGFECLLDSKRQQVDDGLPLSALRIKFKAEDPSVRAVALQAERVPLEANEFWDFLPDSDPSGARLAIFVRGRGVIELPDGREVMSITPGTIVLEGDAAGCGARLRVQPGPFEAYRIRISDLLAAAYANEKPPDWFYHFRLKEREAREKLRKRLTNAKGLRDVTAKHPCDPDIDDWKNRRVRSLRRAKEIRDEKAGVLGANPGVQLPLLAPDDFGTTAYRCWKAGPRKMVDTKRIVNLPRAFPGGVPKGLTAYPCTKLPKISSEPTLRSQAGSRQTDRALVSQGVLERASSVEQGRARMEPVAWNY